MISEEANAFYGDPDYISIKPLLAMNSNIIKSAQLFYKRGLQVDHAVIIETDEEEGLGTEVETDWRVDTAESERLLVQGTKASDATCKVMVTRQRRSHAGGAISGGRDCYMELALLKKVDAAAAKAVEDEAEKAATAARGP